MHHRSVTFCNLRCFFMFVFNSVNLVIHYINYAIHGSYMILLSQLMTGHSSWILKDDIHVNWMLRGKIAGYT
jgi:hypothetical protein